jgi:hypothetical protein
MHASTLGPMEVRSKAWLIHAMEKLLVPMQLSMVDLLGILLDRATENLRVMAQHLIMDLLGTSQSHALDVLHVTILVVIMER